MTSRGNMLRFLTNKLKSQTLNEVRPAIQENDDDHDSGTESDDENPENKDISHGFDEKGPYDTCGSGSTSPVRSSSPVGTLHSGMDSGVMQEISDQNYDSLSCTSDYERQSLDFERHSSEEELAVINKENVAEKRKWSQTQCSGCGGDSAGSSDDEVKEFLLNPQPVLLSSSPPKGIKKVHSHSPAPKLLLARVTPLSVSSVSPRKRHRQTSTSDSLRDSSVLQRPCLDFEKMQQKTLQKKHCSHNLNRTRIVKIRTVNGGSRTPRSMFDPSIFSFRSISMAYNPLTPVEEPSCAY